MIGKIAVLIDRRLWGLASFPGQRTNKIVEAPEGKYGASTLQAAGDWFWLSGWTGGDRA